MLRDFTKPNKDYLFKNRIGIICVSVFLIIGIIILSIFGMNGNFEFKGYNEFSIKAGADTTKYSEIVNTAKEIVNSYDANYTGYSIFGEGENAEIVITYSKNISEENQFKVNQDIENELSVSVTDHTFVKGTVKNSDYIYTATAILVVLLAATIFAYFRYNGASAVSLVFSCVLATLAYLSVGAILRLSVGLSYFAMLVALNALVMFLAFNIFESIRNSSLLGNKNYADALKSAIKDTKLRISLICTAVLIAGLLFVIAAPLALKYVSLNIMFIAVVALATAWYVVPFFWSIFITNPKNKTFKVKVTKEDTNK